MALFKPCITTNLDNVTKAAGQFIVDKTNNKIAVDVDASTRVTIANTDTKNTTGATDFNTADKELYLIGTTTQGTNPVTNSVDSCYVYNNELWSNYTRTITHEIMNNGRDASNSDAKYFAPTELGTQGQLVVSNIDSTDVPGWVSPSELSVGSANKLTTARTITLTGDASGSISFDGSENKELNVTINNGGITENTSLITEIKMSDLAGLGESGIRDYFYNLSLGTYLITPEGTYGGSVYLETSDSTYINLVTPGLIQVDDYYGTPKEIYFYNTGIVLEYQSANANDFKLYNQTGWMNYIGNWSGVITS